MQVLSKLNVRAYPDTTRALLLGASVCICYFVLAKLGLALSTVSNNVTLVWPPTGFAMVALLIFGIRFWPAVLLASLIANISTGLPIGAAVAIAVGNTLEAGVAVRLLQYFAFRPELRFVRDVFLLIIIGAGISTMVSASIGSSALVVFDVIPSSEFSIAWLTWWLGDAMGDLVFAPLLLVWRRREDEIRWDYTKGYEAFLLVLCLFIFSNFIFGSYSWGNSAQYPIAFLIFPFLVWAALRFGMRGAVTSTVIVGGIILYHVIHQQGLFASTTMFEGLMLLWSFTNVISITTLVLAASVNERREAERQMKLIARTDALTKLPNRAALQSLLLNAIYQAQQSSSKVAVLSIDLDRFKVINDTLGHHIGDRLLEIVAKRLSACVNTRDIVVRHGSDEFVMICESFNDVSDIAKQADRVLTRLSESYRFEDYDLHVTPSIGISVYPDDGESVQELLKNADIAMYQAKKEKACYRFYASKMYTPAFQHLTIESHLQHAIQKNEFVLHFQPQFDIKSNKLVAFEALLRWDSPTLGRVMPDEFIPVAEDSGMILKIGEWVIRETCKQLRSWRSEGFQTVPVAVNVSARQLWQTNFFEILESALKENDVDASQLELEMTESVLASYGEETVQLLQRIRSQLGVHITIDDFGTGYSSLSYLKRYPVQKIKIDRSFIREVDRDKNDAKITSTIIAMAHGLNLQVVAEGVEKAEQLAFITNHGCDVAQGFYFAMPDEAAKVASMMQKLS